MKIEPTATGYEVTLNHANGKSRRSGADRMEMIMDLIAEAYA